MAAPSSKLQIVKYAPPPTELPVYGSVRENDVSFIGRTNYVAALEEKRFIFGIKRVDRRRHLYIIGKSGVGKSKLQELLVRQDIAHGHGVCVIDPHGDLVRELLDFIPEERIKDVCLIDPSDAVNPVAFNPLSAVDQEARHQSVQGFLELMQKQFGSAWSARIEHILRFALLALLEYPGANLDGIARLLAESDYRETVIKHVEDPMTRHFWEEEFTVWSDKFNTDAVVPILNKFSQFFAITSMRKIFSQPENKIRFEDLAAQKKIVLVNLAQEKIGEDNASFFGSMILQKVKEAGMKRARDEKGTFPDFYLYLDEFEKVITESFDNFLSGSRKYGINITLANQYMGQLSKKIQHAVLGNAGTLIVFRVGGEDATALKSEFAPVFEIKDMINLGITQFYIKMTIDGESYDPFSAESLKVLPVPHASNKEQVIDNSRKSYAVSGSPEEMLKSE